MQGTRIRLLVGGLVLASSFGLQAETLQPDPAWQEGKLDNGFNWQLLATPQRPSDRIELRLVVNTGSLVESATGRLQSSAAASGDGAQHRA